MSEQAPDAVQRTVFDRVYRPTPDSILYHYCSASTFLSVVTNNTLRFSDINMMNDAEECRYGYRLFERAANEMLESANEVPALEGLTADYFDKIDQYLSPKQLHSHPVIACFSKAPDVLSQWRAYAQDAEGFAIGFDGEALKAMPVMLLDVLYDPDEQMAEVKNFLSAMYQIWRTDGGDFHQCVGTPASLLASLMVAYKHPSFREEQEVRAIHELRVDISEEGWTLTDEGGTANGREIPGQLVQFRAAGSSIIAYVDLPLERADDRGIREVWFGPRNHNGPANAHYPLTQHGHRGVRLRYAASPYRG